MRKEGFVSWVDLHTSRAQNFSQAQIGVRLRKKSHFGAKRSADDISVLPYWYLIGKYEKGH